MIRRPNQDKALQWYVQENGLRPSLSAHPVYYFVDKSGKEIKAHIQRIETAWEIWREHNKKGENR